MSGKQLLLAVMAAALLTASAIAQDDKNEITGILGRTFIADQGIPKATFFNPFIRSGKGLTFEANYGRRLWGNGLIALTGEVPVAFNFKDKLNSGADVVPVSYSSYFITPSARLNVFSETHVSPWISLGAGFGHFSESNDLLFGGTNPGKSGMTSAIQAGFGLDVRVWRELNVRGQVRDFWSGEPDFPLAPTGKSRQHNLFVGGGVTWHFNFWERNR